MIYRSREPWDITDFEFVAAREMTYPQPWHVPEKGFLLLFTKYSQGRELYFATSSDGRTWSEDRKLAGIGGHYQVSAPAGTAGRIGTFFNRHPGGNVDRGSALNHTYARRPLHARDPFYAFWADGDPDSFGPSHFYFTGRTGARVWRLPANMDGNEAEPVAVEPSLAD